MLHDLLLALAGHKGDLIIENDGTFTVVADFPLVHPGELVLLNSLASLGHDYSTIREFVTTTLVEGVTNGFYRHALAVGVDAELDGYRQTILQTEAKILRESHTPLGEVVNEFEPYRGILRELSHIVTSTRKQNLQGGAILSLVTSRLQTSVGVQLEVLNRLQIRCMRVLYRLLTSWMVYGLLPEVSGAEFFIQLAPTEQNTKTDTSASSGDNVSSYVLNPEQLPSIISKQTAELILFTGRAWQAIRKSSTIQRDTGEENELCDLLWQDAARESISLGRSWEGVEQVHERASQKLCELLSENKLIAHFMFLRNFFFLGRGDIFVLFMEETDRLASSIRSRSDLTLVLRQSCRKVGLEDLQMLGNIRAVSSQENIFAFLGSSVDLSYAAPWPVNMILTSATVLKYNKIYKLVASTRWVQLLVQKTWPSQRQMWHGSSSKKTSVEWVNIKTSINNLSSKRAQVSFLLDNLFFYLQVDVIEPAFAELLDGCRQATNYAKLQEVHDKFLAKITNQCFLDMAPILDALLGVLKSAHRFYLTFMRAQMLALHWAKAEAVEGHQQLDSILAATTEASVVLEGFFQHASFLLRSLSRLKTGLDNPHVEQLLLRIDYNGFFSQRFRLLESLPVPLPT